MTAAELLKPRFEVIADYPNCPFKVGAILSKIENATNNYFGMDNCVLNAIRFDDIEKYPRIFKPLNWWEHRNVEDMPKKVKCIIKGASNEGCVYDVEKIDLENELICIDKRHGVLFCFEPID
jgi:hypothetical protein